MVIHPPLLHRLDALAIPCRWEIYAFSLPLVTGGERTGFVLRTDTDPGVVSWGEIAPLPGRSQESAEDVLEQLLAYLTQGITQGLSPSVRFGLESLFHTAHFPIHASTYAFLNGSAEAILERADIAQKKGYTTVKLKLCQFGIEEAQDLLRTLQGRFRLRVDCNNAFSFHEATRLFAPFDPSLFDYIEDPTHEWDALPHFTHPFALDETVLRYPQLPYSDNLYGFILKPTLLGGRAGCAPLIHYARARNLKTILSPAFETGLGLLQILKLGQEFDLLDSSLIGLDTHRFLQHDLLEDPLCFDTPRIHIRREPTINTTLLTRLAHGTATLPPL